ncbi:MULTISPECIES: hypothetical protein [Pseudofrankia]|uniref:hypothetical protein n=1 Tax=Pseudofrankia TaxID=2994363 RepID=UPI000234B597|nr:MULTISPECIES: hypothetical protein [Pseudofrankia]
MTTETAGEPATVGGTPPEDTAAPVPGARRTSSGPGRLLVAVYAVFAVAATSRALVQIITKFDEAPVAYLLSAFAGVVYILATIGLTRSSAGGRRLATAACAAELAGVLTVGTLSVVDRDLFPDEAVWSVYGQGYFFLPVVLPALGLWWLRRTAPPVRLPD